MAGVELRYRIVDVFSERPLAGNALAVVLDPCPEAVMQPLARELNLSETTFPLVFDQGPSGPPQRADRSQGPSGPPQRADRRTVPEAPAAGRGAEARADRSTVPEAPSADRGAEARAGRQVPEAPTAGRGAEARAGRQVPEAPAAGRGAEARAGRPSPTPPGGGAYEVRIFTPVAELPFAGHPSLGTAWTLGPGTWRQTSAGGTVLVEADASGSVMTQPDPVLEPVVDMTPAVSALGLPGAEAVFTSVIVGMGQVLVLTEAPLGRIEPDLSALAGLSRAHGAAVVGVARRLDDRTLHVRVFAPTSGVPEDPGTGSAAGPIGLLARLTWSMDEDLTVLQGAEIGRPCRIEVHAVEGAVRVGGRVSPCAEGRFTL